MCGLLFALIYVANDDVSGQESSAEEPDPIASFTAAIKCRGPDAQHEHVVKLPSLGGHLELSFSAAVLGLRGPLTPQPIVGKRGILGWNGQVFEGMGGEGNDTAWLAERLEAGEDLGSLLAGIEGPYAMYYYELDSRTLHVRLDPLHRRSMLMHRPTAESSSQALVFASVRPEVVHSPMELVEAGFTVLMDDVRITDNVLDLSDALHPVQLDISPSVSSVAPINTAIPSEASLASGSNSSDQHVSAFIDALAESVKLRVENIPPPSAGHARLGILFSGGIDCTMVAYLASRYIPIDEPIDLLNVAFENPRSLQAAANVQKAAEQRLAKLQKKAQAKSTSLEQIVVLDKGKGRATYDVPDRLSGREAVEELTRVCPGRRWRLVEVDVTYEECMERREHVKGLMYPADTEMDISLALPLFFASRGIGKVADEPYASQAKVLLSGLGADEQLGGYSRHRRAFERASWAGLIDEIQMDITRLPSRNLSRDDRVISSNARDARYPFLSLTFIRYLSNLPVHVKCDPRSGEGEGDKILLREAARSVGLVGAADRKKRAMQFGTRSAKMTVEPGRGGGDRKVH